MAADVDAVAVVLHGARDTADLVVRLKHGDVGDAGGLQFQRCSEACGPGTDDDGGVLAQAWSPGAIARRAVANSSALRTM